MKPLNIVFFGTADFGIPTLDKVISDGHKISAIVTVPDKPSGRGLKKVPSPIKKHASSYNLPILTPTKLKEETFIETLKSFDADLFIVVAFRKLPRKVWEIPKGGTINLHASLLPDYRGAAPINHAIINGEKYSGVTTFFINEKIDEGNILLQYPTEIPFHWTAGELYEHLKYKGADLVATTLLALQNQNILPKKQNSVSNKKAPKIFPKDCEIDWNKTSLEIYNFIRGLSPYPAAYTYFNGKILKIYFSEISDLTEQAPIGKVHYTKKQMFVRTKDGWLEIRKLKLQGKRLMETSEFLNGLKEKPEFVGK